MKPNDRVRVVAPRSELRGMEGYVVGWPGTHVTVRLDRVQPARRRRVYVFRLSDVELVGESEAIS